MNKQLIRLLVGLIDGVERDIENQSMKEIIQLNHRQRERLINQAVDIITDEEMEDNHLAIPARSRQEIKNEISRELDANTVKEFEEEAIIIGAALTRRAEETYQVLRYFYEVVLEVDFGSQFGTDFFTGSAGTPLSFGGLTPDEIQDIVNQNIKSELWSDRLWTNKKALNKDLRKELYDLIDGKTDVNQISQRVSMKYRRSYSEARRLVRNEGTRVQSAVNDEWAERRGVEEQIYTATLDNRTTGLCRNLDGTIYKRDDPAKPKIPDDTHINCRSVYVDIPYEGWRPKKRYDNLNKRTVNYQTYKEWANGS